MAHSTDPSQLQQLIGQMRKGNYDEALVTTPFLFNALEQFDALHIIFGNCLCLRTGIA